MMQEEYGQAPRGAANEMVEQYFSVQVQRQKSRRRKKQRRNRTLAALLALLLCGVAGGITLVHAAGSRRAGPGAARGPDALPAAGLQPGPNGYVIALDAGHGGHDVGAEGILQEVDLTEGTIRELEALLAADERFAPVLCRPYGEAADRATRAENAAAEGAHLILSVHANSSPVANAYGFECFPVPPGREHNAESVRFALLIAEEIGLTGSRLRGENGVRYMYYEERPGGTYESVVREMSDGSVYKHESFGLLEKAGCPAVLAEQGFINSSDDMMRFGGPEGYRRAAECYYKAICRYFQLEPLAL